MSPEDGRARPVDEAVVAGAVPVTGRRRSVPVRGLAVAALTGGLVLAACSSSPSTTPTTRGSTSTTRPSTTSTTRPTTTTGRSGTTTTTTRGSTRCTTGNLVGAIVGSTGAAGTIEVTVSLKSTAAAACILGGYPGLQLLGAGGAVLPTTVVRKGAYGFTGMAPVTVTLTTGQSAEFNLGYTDVTVGTETSCPTSSQLEVTPPAAYDHLTLAATLAPCAHGTMTVSPVFPAFQSTSESTAPPS